MAQNQGFNKKSRLKEICRTPVYIHRKDYIAAAYIEVCDGIFTMTIHPLKINDFAASERNKKSDS